MSDSNLSEKVEIQAESQSHETVVRAPRKRIKTGMLLFEIALFIIAFIFIYPALYVLVNAFKGTQEIVVNPAGLPRAPTLENFYKVLTLEGAGGYTFPKALLNTVIITAGSVAGVLLFSSMAAYALVRRKTKVSSFIYAFFAFFLVIPFQIIMVPLVVEATDLQFQNVMGLILMYWGLGAPTAVFMFHGFIKSVPISTEESAAIDGAGQWRTFFQIVMPLMSSIIATLTILDILWIWNDFLLPYIILKQGTLVLFQFNFFGQFTQDYGALTASLVMSAAPVLVLYLTMQRFIVKGIAAGAVKG